MDDLGLTALDVLDLGSAAGRRRSSAEEPLVVELVRVLVPEDLEVIRHPPAKPAKIDDSESHILRITNSHHQIARLLATGTNNTQTAALSGHSPAYISRLQKDPSFRDLLAYYAQNQELVFVEANERMKAFGLDVLEELHARFMENPADFSRKELAELTELYLVKAQAARGLAQGATNTTRPQVQIGISFVKPQEGQLAGQEGPTGGLVIDGESIHVIE